MSLSTRHKSWHKEFLPTHSAKKKRKEKSQSTLWSKARVFDLVIKSDGRRAALKSRQSRAFAWKKKKRRANKMVKKTDFYACPISIIVIIPPTSATPPLLMAWPKNQLTFQSIFHVGSPCRVRVGKDNRFPLLFRRNLSFFNGTHDESIRSISSFHPLQRKKAFLQKRIDVTINKYQNERKILTGGLHLLSVFPFDFGRKEGGAGEEISTGRVQFSFLPILFCFRNVKTTYCCGFFRWILFSFCFLNLLIVLRNDCAGGQIYHLGPIVTGHRPVMICCSLSFLFCIAHARMTAGWKKREES